MLGLLQDTKLMGGYNTLHLSDVLLQQLPEDVSPTYPFYLPCFLPLCSLLPSPYSSLSFPPPSDAEIVFDLCLSPFLSEGLDGNEAALDRLSFLPARLEIGSILTIT